ncbi:hypothetical protein CTI12_AA205950 [Artemisia annua]|uniref:ATPase AAA-type core domain-containing protein n=1 Tax=Artemisia annua TaxID=35608 RepID=A0A2U1P0R4_ARTAN|nr:hypothetical protein CTI12_AA205950 [Artemisia annua]
MARSKKACIVFFDEVDAVGGARFDDGAGGDNEVQRTMLEIVNQLDGFDARGNIKVLMATNRCRLMSVCTEAGMYAIRAPRKTVTEKDFLDAVNKVIKGYQKFSATPKYMCSFVQGRDHRGTHCDLELLESILGFLKLRQVYFKVIVLEPEPLIPVLQRLNLVSVAYIPLQPRTFI